MVSQVICSASKGLLVCSRVTGIQYIYVSLLPQLSFFPHQTDKDSLVYSTLYSKFPFNSSPTTCLHTPEINSHTIQHQNQQRTQYTHFFHPSQLPPSHPNNVQPRHDQEERRPSQARRQGLQIFEAYTCRPKRQRTERAIAHFLHR